MPYLRRGFLKSANRSKRLITGFEIMPFLSVTIVLLCIFMTKDSYHHGGTPVELTKSAHAHKLPLATREDAIRIAVARDGSIYFGNAMTDWYLKLNGSELGVLPNRIHDSVLNGAEKHVYLRVDARTKYSNVEEVIDQVSLSGVQNLSFITN